MVVCLIAALAYACLYAAFPSRTRTRIIDAARTRRLLFTGLASLVASGILGGFAYGPVLGPLVALAAALTTGSVLALIAPWVASS